VRNSWLTFWKNRVFARSSSASAAARARSASYASASVSAVDTWLATSPANTR